MWGQPPSPDLSEAEGVVRSGEARLSSASRVVKSLSQPHLPQIESRRSMQQVDAAGSFLVGTWLSLVEHSLGVRGVGSSNLPVPTIRLKTFLCESKPMWSGHSARLPAAPQIISPSPPAQSAPALPHCSSHPSYPPTRFPSFHWHRAPQWSSSPASRKHPRSMCRW